MKRFRHSVPFWASALACLFVLACGSDDDPAAPAPSAPTFQHRLSVTGNDEFYALSVLDDGTLLAGGSTRLRREDDSTHDDAFLAAFDAAGDTLWTTRYGAAESHEAATDVIGTAAGDFVLAGSVAPPAPRSDLFCTRIDRDGATAWSLELSQDGFDRPERILATGDGGWLLAGQASNMGGGSAASIIKLDDDGAEQWRHAVSFGDTCLSGVDVRELDDGGYLVAADSYIRSDEFRNMWLLEIGADGARGPCRCILLPGRQNVHAVLPLPDGGARLVGQTEDDPYHSLFLADVDSLGAPRTVRHAYLPDAFWIEDARFTADGGAVLCGGMDRDGFVVKLDAEGGLEWTRRFVQDGEYTVLHAAVEHRGGYAFAGTIMNLDYTGRDALLVRVDGDGGD